MDPDATLKIVKDEGLSLSERGEAAMNYLIWYARIGSTAGPFAVAACEGVLVKVLDAIEES